MIGISTKLFDLNGSHTFQSGTTSEIDSKITRRVSTTKTLDGGSYVSDGGYSDSDKVINFKVFDLDEDTINKLNNIAKNHSRIYVCLRSGAYEGTIKQIYTIDGATNFNIIVVGGA